MGPQGFKIPELLFDVRKRSRYSLVIIRCFFLGILSASGKEHSFFFAMANSVKRKQAPPGMLQISTVLLSRFMLFFTILLALELFWLTITIVCSVLEEERWNTPWLHWSC